MRNTSSLPVIPDPRSSRGQALIGDPGSLPFVFHPLPLGSALKTSLHVPAFFHLEIGNVLSKRIRRDELASGEGEVILKELQRVPLQKHSNERLITPAFALAVQTKRSFYDCLYLALAEAIDGQVVTADRKFCSSLAASHYAKRMLWVEDL